MITALYAGLLTLLLIVLSLRVVAIRRADSISLGDGGNLLLQRRIRAQGNLAEYGPIGLILLLALEASGTTGWIVHVFGVAFVVARLMHAAALSTETKRPFLRVQGMILTFSVLLLAGLVAILAGLGVVL